MPLSIGVRRSFTKPGGQTISAEATQVGTTYSELDQSFATATTDEEVPFALSFTNLQAVYFKSDQDVTVKTNDDGSPDDEFELKANVPLEWTQDDPTDNPITADITSVFITNASGATARVQLAALYN